MASVESPEKLWSPPDGVRTQMDEFRIEASRKFNLDLGNYNDLYHWSCEHYDQFWDEFFRYSKIVHSAPYTTVVDTSLNVSQKPKWFDGCRLNYAENLLRHRNSDRTAVIFAGEGRKTEHISFSQLYSRVQQLAVALKAAGVNEGDRVAGYLPNCPMALEAMLATTMLGGVWSSASPDFGVSGVLERFCQISPKILFSVNAVIYNAKSHDHLEKLTSVVEGLPSLEKVVVLDYTEMSAPMDISNISNAVSFTSFLSSAVASQADSSGDEVAFTQVPFDHPLFIMFSSGTTGKPKCMVHSVGGTLIQHLKEHLLHGNMTQNDIIMYYTTTGWMMWNWLVTSLATGAAIVLYDGSPFKPTPYALWDLVDEIGITILGTGAKWLSALEDRDIKPVESHSLKTLHTILSTGSPLKPMSYSYVYRAIKSDLLLGSITGGTDLISCFAGQNPSVPVYRGEIQSRNLAMAVECWSHEGKPVFDESGELVCTKPFPSMPTAFLNDPDGSKYDKAYFLRFPGVWHHGDYCTLSSTTGGILMQGRSDGTLNPSGVRFGSSEIYNVVEAFAEVEDSLCVGQAYQEDERVVLFVKMADTHSFSPEFRAKLQVQIRSQLSARHVPTFILPIPDIPYTVSGKKVEVAVKKILSGHSAAAQEGALRNPQSLQCYVDIPELKV
ncbi:acetoacetyl-CoA synthetase-like [Sycon ciliatum]|uniref:acetoacetyl-CoA synthetase-like n=1 Tax=Sycon ciliatum TaxID=27933 RepID=UPI0020ACABEB|eukprot:scpid50402/ scgid12446/ Acetoacetyl-CoA synthetase